MDYIYGSVGVAISHIDGLNEVTGNLHEISPEQNFYYSYDGNKTCNFLRGYEEQSRFYASDENSSGIGLTSANLYKSVPTDYGFVADAGANLQGFYCAGHRKSSILFSTDSNLYFPYNEDGNYETVTNVVTPELFFGGIENGLHIAGVQRVGSQTSTSAFYVFLYGGYTNYIPVSEIKDGTSQNINYYGYDTASDFIASAILIPEDAYVSFLSCRCLL